MQEIKTPQLMQLNSITNLEEKDVSKLQTFELISPDLNVNQETSRDNSNTRQKTTLASILKPDTFNPFGYGDDEGFFSNRRSFKRLRSSFTKVRSHISNDYNKISRVPSFGKDLKVLNQELRQDKDDEISFKLPTATQVVNVSPIRQQVNQFPQGLPFDQELSQSRNKRKEKESRKAPTCISVEEKRRGRKREKWEVYLEAATKKINDIREKLKNAKQSKMPVKERQKLRNQISAQQSRLKKKYEVIYLYDIVQKKDDKLDFLKNIITETLKDQPEVLLKLTNKLQNEYSPTLPCGHKRGFNHVFDKVYKTSENELYKYQQNEEKNEDDYKKEREQENDTRSNSS